jgi:Micrococcal nuclease (thermonuclease) homologs
MLIVFIVVAHAAVETSEFVGKVVGVSDGDTIKVMKDGKVVKVRLAEIDCPEKHQDFGMAAKKFTSDMVFGKDVTVLGFNSDQYGRLIAHVVIADKNLNAELIKAGMAWHYKQYSKVHFVDFAKMEQDARDKKIGLWSVSNPVAPWEFRREKKKK